MAISSEGIIRAVAKKPQMKKTLGARQTSDPRSCLLTVNGESKILVL